MRLTYQAPMIGYEYQNKGGPSSVAEAKPDYDGESPNEPTWDEDLPWAEWHSVDDPIKGRSDNCEEYVIKEQSVILFMFMWISFALYS